MILIFGSTGQVGHELKKQLGSKAICPDRHESDFSKPDQIHSLLKQIRPTQIYNASAYTDVDGAERDALAAQTINAETPRLIARWCSENEVPWIHYSTDYVFSGTPPSSRGWSEDDAPAPLGVYGATKLEGERAIQAIPSSKALIFRTSWVYSDIRKNFIKTLLHLAQQKKTIPIVTDQKGAPTYAEDLARCSIQAMEQAAQMPAFPSGIYHLCHGGAVSRFEWAAFFFESLQAAQPSFIKPELKPILTAQFREQFPLAAQRPLDSRLSMDKIQRTLGVQMPPWEEGMKKLLRKLVS